MPLGLLSHSFVEPSMSVNRKVTVPVGGSAISSEQPPFAEPHYIAWQRAAEIYRCGMLAESALNTVFIWKSVRPGCLPRILATMPVMCGAAKLLPVAVIQPPSAHATRTSMPDAPNSTGGSGL